jgi:UTP--glucose-1-phosphate uridylyltransferase
LRVGHYLCFFGMHVLTSEIFTIMEKQMTEMAQPGELPLVPAQQELARHSKYLGLEVAGQRYDTGRKFGLLRAQVALGLAGEEHDELLTTLMESLIEARQGDALFRGQ